MNLKTILNIYKVKNKCNKDTKKENNNNRINEGNISDISEVINPKNSDLSIIKDKDKDKDNIEKKKLKFIGTKKIKIIRKLLTKKSSNLLKDNDNFLKISNEREKESKGEEKKDRILMTNTRLNFAKRLIERSEKNKHKYNKSADDIKEIFDKFLKNRDDKKEFKRIFSPLDDGFREGLKEVKKDKGQYIWIKRSTANLLLFGNSFKLMADDTFYKEHKRIIEKYPGLERDAKIILPEKKVKENKEIINKLENNGKTIKNIFDESEKIVKGVHLKLSKYSMKYSNSQPSIIHKYKKF